MEATATIGQEQVAAVVGTETSGEIIVATPLNLILRLLHHQALRLQSLQPWLDHRVPLRKPLCLL